MTRYMVVAEGAGEYESDFTVTWFDAASPEEAAEIAISPEQGYGRKDGGKMYVVPADQVTEFDTTQRYVTVLSKPEE